MNTIYTDQNTIQQIINKGSSRLKKVVSMLKTFPLLLLLHLFWIQFLVISIFFRKLSDRETSDLGLLLFIPEDLSLSNGQYK